MKNLIALLAVFGMLSFGVSNFIVAQDETDEITTEVVQDSAEEEVQEETAPVDNGLFTPGNEAGTGMFLLRYLV